MNKVDLRLRAAAYRSELSEDAYRSSCEAIRARIHPLPEWRAEGLLHSFWPMVDRREVDLRPLLRARLEAGRPLVLPVMSRTSEGEPTLRHRLLHKEEDLEENHRGVLEPRGGPWIDPGEIATVLVPALAVRPDGYRVGYGRGYYDRFLAETDAATVCPIFDACTGESFDPEPHDVPVEVIVTEHRVDRPGDRSG